MPLYLPPPAALVRGQVLGTATNDDAAAGNVGEYVSLVVTSGAAVALSTGTSANVTSISLTPGDWDVEGHVVFSGGATTNISVIQASTSLTSATLLSPVYNKFYNQVPFGNVSTISQPIPTIRYSLSATTTIFFVVNAFFSVSTLNAFGNFRARRVR